MALTDQEELEYLSLLEAEEIALARTDLATFAEYILEMPPANHHKLIIEALEQAERGELDLVLLMFPPGSAKSTYGSVVFPAWYLGRNPKKCLIAASHTGELAERFGRKVRNTITSKPYRRVFPNTSIAADSSAAGRWDTSVGGEYFAAGVGGSVTGRRADLAVIDDPVKSREEADSKTIRDKQWSWWTDDLKTRMKPGSAIVLIMTRWHEDDLAGRVLADLKDTNARVKVVSVPMEAEDKNDPLGRQPGEMLWPEWFTPDMVAEAKREPRRWTSLYQQRPVALGGGDFKREWMLNYSRQPAAANKVILVDPSSGKRRDRGDFTSMWVIGRGADLNYYILDGVRDRLNLTERAEKLVELVRKWRPLGTFYEEYGMQADIAHIKDVQERTQFRFRIMSIGGGMPKVDRIKRLVPTLQQGSLWTPETMVRQCADGHQRDIMKELIDEMMAFPVGANDDALDNLARIHDDAVQKLLASPQAPAKQPFTIPFIPYDADIGY